MATVKTTFKKTRMVELTVEAGDVSGTAATFTVPLESDPTGREFVNTWQVVSSAGLDKASAVAVTVPTSGANKGYAVIVEQGNTALAEGDKITIHGTFVD